MYLKLAIIRQLFCQNQNGSKNFGYQSHNFIPYLLITAHSIASFFLYINYAYIPDEIWFLEHALASKEQGILDTENAFAYGSLYWLIHKFAIFTFEDPWLGVRYTYLALLITGNFAFLKIIEKINPDRSLIAVLFYLSLPLAWWQGKITGPEPLAHFLLLIGTYFGLILQNKKLVIAVSGIFFGLSIGVKLSSLTMTMGLIAVYLYYKVFCKKEIITWLKSLSMLGLSILIGIVASNPFIAFSPEVFLSNLPKTNVEIDFMVKFSQIMFGNDWLWEVVPIGSASKFGAPIFVTSLLVIVSFLLGASKFILLVSIATWVSTIAICLQAPTFFGWYFYSPIMLSPILLAQGKRQLNFLLKSLVSFIISFSLYSNTGITYQMIKNKLDHIEVLNNVQHIQNTFSQLELFWKPDLIVDFSEFNTILLTNNDTNEENHISTSERRKLQSLEFLWNHHASWIRNKEGKVISCPKIDEFNTIMILIGERVSRKKGLMNSSTRDWLESTFVNECPFWKTEYYTQQNKIHYLVIRKKDER